MHLSQALLIFNYIFGTWNWILKQQRKGSIKWKNIYLKSFRRIHRGVTQVFIHIALNEWWLSETVWAFCVKLRDFKLDQETVLIRRSITKQMQYMQSPRYYVLFPCCAKTLSTALYCLYYLQYACLSSLLVYTQHTKSQLRHYWRCETSVEWQSTLSADLIAVFSTSLLQKVPKGNKKPVSVYEWPRRHTKKWRLTLISNAKWSQIDKNN